MSGWDFKKLRFNASACLGPICSFDYSELVETRRRFKNSEADIGTIEFPINQMGDRGDPVFGIHPLQ